MNERSSRSHAVLSLAVESRLKDGDSTVKVASLVCLSLLPYPHLSLLPMTPNVSFLTGGGVEYPVNKGKLTH